MIDRLRASRLGILVFIVVAAVASAASAAKFEKRDYSALNDPVALDFEPRCQLQMSGEIVGPDAAAGQIGDYERARIALEEFRASPERVAAPGADRDKLVPSTGFFALCLSSEGGDLREALRVANLFGNVWMTVVEEGHVCLSACAVLFMQAKRRDGVFSSNLDARFPGRYMHYGAQLGFHAPALIYPKGSSDTVAKAEAEEAYRQALISVEALLPSEQMLLAAPLQFDDTRPLFERLAELSAKHQGTMRSEEDFPARLLVRMLTTPNSDMLWVKTLGEAHEYGIDVFGLAMPKRLTDRMVMAACASVVHTRCGNLVPRGQCGYAFATESGLLAIPRGVPGATAISAMIKSLQPGPKQFALETAAGQREKIAAMLADWEPQRTSLWPANVAQAGLRAEAVALQRRQALGWVSPCAVTAYWAGQQLVDLELQTLNGFERNWLVAEPLAKRDSGPGWLTVQAPVSPAAKMQPVAMLTPRPGVTLPEAHAALVARLAAPETASRLRWYKMLPPTTPLAELADDVWQWYEQGSAIGPAITGAATRASAIKVPGGLSQAAVVEATVRMQAEYEAKKASGNAGTPSALVQAGMHAFHLPAWTRTVEGGTLKLVSPPVKGKEGVSMHFSVLEKPADKGGMEAWFKARVAAQVAGKTIRKQQGLMRKAAVWIDAVSLPNATNTAGGTVILYKAWQTRNGAQFVIETQPEHVEYNDSAAIEAEALVSKLSVVGAELTPAVLAAVAADKVNLIQGLKN